jgi:hypothetical protein
MPPPARSPKNHPEWPSVRQQIDDARAPVGSRLEQLIRQNQELELLHPSEANDGLPFPPWLRIRWRKAHPDDYQPGALVAYPLMLERVREWLIHNPDAADPSDDAGGAPDERTSDGGRSR